MENWIPEGKDMKKASANGGFLFEVLRYGAVLESCIIHQFHASGRTNFVQSLHRSGHRRILY